MKYLMLIIANLLLFSSCGHSHDHEHGHEHHQAPTQQSNPPYANLLGEEPINFPTIGFEQSHEVIIPFSTIEVCPLFEPDGRHLIYDWWNPTVLREGKDGTLKGLMTVSTYQEHEIFLIVTEHRPDAGHLQYLVLWDDFELQRIDITCEQGETASSTKVIWTERNAGIHENGVSMVSHFVKDGHLVGIVEKYSKKVEEHLQNKMQDK